MTRPLVVMLTNDDGAWFAQALEIDYAAEGTSQRDVKRRFERGLNATVMTGGFARWWTEIAYCIATEAL